MAQWIKCLLCKYKDLSLHPWKLSKRKSTGMVPGACNPSTGGQRRADPGTLLVSQFLQSFTQSLVRDCLKKWGGYGQGREIPNVNLCLCWGKHRCTHMHTRAYTQVHTQVSIQVYTHSCIHNFTQVYTQVHTEVHTHVGMHTHRAYLLDLLL